MSTRTLPTTARQQPPAAVAAKSRRRFWANLVVQVSGLLAMLVVAVHSASAQVVTVESSPSTQRIQEAYIGNPEGAPIVSAIEGQEVALWVIMLPEENPGENKNFTFRFDIVASENGNNLVAGVSDIRGLAVDAEGAYDPDDMRPNIGVRITLDSVGDGGPRGQALFTLNSGDGPEGTEYLTLRMKGNSTRLNQGLDPIPDLVLTILDNDPAPGVSISATTLELTEGIGKTYSVKLDTQPSVGVLVTVAVSDENAGVALDPARLTFGTNNWGVEQSVMVTAAVDGLYNTKDRIVTLTHTVQGGDYGDVSADDVVVTILNNDDRESEPTEIRLSLEPTAVVESVFTDSGRLPLDLMVTTKLDGEIALDQDTIVTFRILEDPNASGFERLFAAVVNPDSLPAAVSPQDFSLVYPQRIVSATIPAGAQFAEVATLSLNIHDDIVPEISELLVVTGTAGGFTVIPAALRIDDNDPVFIRFEQLEDSVPEGEVFTYTVRLQPYPSIDTQVTVEVVMGQDAVGNFDNENKMVLTFPGGEISGLDATDPQQVAVMTLDNVDFGESPQEVKLRHTVTDGDLAFVRGLPAETVTLTITDSDRAGIEILISYTEGPLPGGGLGLVAFENESEEEGDDNEYAYTVKLLSQPDADVSVTMTIEGDATLGALIGEVIKVDGPDDDAPLILLFTENTWNVPQEVLFITPNNKIYTEDQRVTITHTVSSDHLEYQVEARSQSPAETEVEVLVRERDRIPTGRINLNLRQTEGEEGDTIDNFNIFATWAIGILGDTEVVLRLNDESDIDFLIRRVPPVLASVGEVAEEDDYLLSPEVEEIVLTIPSGGTASVQETSVQLQIFDDNDEEDNEYIVFGGTANIRGEPVSVSPVAFSINANDPSGVRFTLDGSKLDTALTTERSLDEGETLEYSVVLESRPSDNVTVAVIVSGDEGYGEEITILANDEVDLTEGGTLIFTSENWDEPQTVMVEAADNDYYRGGLEVTLGHSTAGGNGAYDTLPVPTIELNIIENDVPPTGIQLSLDMEEVGEESGTVVVQVTARLLGTTFGVETTVGLRINHSNDTMGVRVLETLAVEGKDYYSDVGSAVIRIPRLEREGMVDVSLDVLRNFIDEDDKILLFGGTVTTEPELGISLDVEVETAFLRITDDDERGLVFSPLTDLLLVPEGRSKVYTLALTSEPTGTVNVDLRVTLGEYALAEIEPQQLTFSAGGDNRWNIPQEVSIRPLNNNNKNPDVSVIIQHTASGGDYGGVEDDYALTIEDDESPSKFVNVSTNIAGVAEEDGKQKVTLTVKLNGSPFDVATSVNLSIDDDSSAMAETDLLSARIFLGPTPKGDLMDGMVTVEIPQATSTIKVILELTPKSDDIDEGGFETIVISGSGIGLDSRDKATIQINDDDNAGISLSKTRLQVAEGGDAVTYTVSLDSQPLGDVQVSLIVNGLSNNLIQLEPEVWTFTPDDWNASRTRTVEVSAREDDARNDIRQLTISHVVATAQNNDDGYYEGIPVQILPLELIDPSVLISPQSATVIEGASAEYGVRLTSEPTSLVTVTVTVLEGARDEIDYLQLVAAGEVSFTDEGEQELTLTFDSTNWKAYQTVTIVTVNNDYSGTNPLVVIEHTVSSKGDYAGVTAEDFTLDITDDEFEDAATSVLLSLEPTTVDENDGDGFAIVRLTARLDGPTRNEMTTMTLRINDSNNIPSEISMEDLAMEDVDFTLRDPTTSTFELTIPAFQQSAMIELLFDLVDDDLDEGDSEQIVISGEAGTLAVDPATLEINDDDFRGVTVMPTELFVAEDADAVIYSVVLTSEPAGEGPVEVLLEVIYASVADEIAPDMVLFNGEPGSLTLFFGGTGSDNPWNEPQEVSVTLMVNDDIDGARDATIEHSVSGADYDGVRVEDVLLTLTDYGVLVSRVVLNVDEGGSSSYRLSLTSEPTGSVTVKIVIPPPYDGVLSAEPTTYIFNAENWSAGVDVTVTLAGDDLFNEDRVLTIEHRVIASEDPNYEGLEVAGVEVTLIDDEEQPELLLELFPDSGEEGSGDNTTVAVTAIVSLEGALRSEDTMGTLSFEGVSDDTATVDEDYKSQAITFTIMAKERSVEVSFKLDLIADQIDEGDNGEFFTITASDDDNLLDSVSAPFTIADDDHAAVRVTLEDQSVREGDEIRYTVVLESDPIENVRVDVTVVKASVDSEALPGNVRVEVVEGSLPLTFNSDNWSVRRDILLTVESDLAFFGELEIRHTATGDPTYAALPPVSAVLELTDVDLDLGDLEVMTAAGVTTGLLDSAGGEIGFSADVTEYFATVPFPDQNAFITATPSVIEDRPDEQEKGRVRIFRKNGDGTPEALESGADVASTATEVNLPEGDTFAFLIEVSARPLPPADGEEIARRTYTTYTLTLRRALPASAELQVYLATDADRQEPITALDFGPDDDPMDLILILRGDGNIRYSISGIDISGSVSEFADPVVGDEIKTDVVDFETPVTLSRADDVDDDVSYSLLFTATPERPMADANPLSATIEGTLKANTDTRTEIQATYLGEHQDEKELILPDAAIRVSNNGAVTIELSVVRSGGGDRTFEQSSFTIAIGQADVPAVLDGGCDCYILEIAPRNEPLALTFEAEAASSLAPKINTPLALAFTVSFESPQAVIRAVANPDPLLAFSRPFFAFVGEDMQLPLEVVLADGSTPLADSDSERDRILSELALAVKLDGEGALNTVIIAAEGDRDLKFDINEPKNSVTVEVAVVSGGENPLVDVEPLAFTAHFLSLEHDEEIDFREDPDLDLASRISELRLKGEDESDDSWRFKVINGVELEDDQYGVLEVIPAEAEKKISTIITKVPSDGDGSTTAYTVRTETVLIVNGVESGSTVVGEESPLDEAEAREKYEGFAAFADDSDETSIIISVDTIKATYTPFRSGMDIEDRLLQVTRLHPGAEDSRIVLEFEYFLDGRSAGVFTRAIDLINGEPSNLKVEVAPSVLVVAKGGAPGQVQLVISNLEPGYDLSALEEDSIVLKVVEGDPSDLAFEQQGRGTIDRINRRFEQTYSVTAVAAANGEYTVKVEVRLFKETVDDLFTVDINDAPQYDDGSDTELTVSESEPGEVVKEYLLKIVDEDGGSKFLAAEELSLEVIGFDYRSKVMDVGEDYDNGYFKLAFSDIVADGQVGMPNGKRNSLAVTLTLTGVLATPFNSVVELRLFGVSDGFDDFEQYLTVWVMNEPPMLELERTEAIPVFLEQEPTSIKVTSTDVTDVVVLKAPADLVVKYDYDATGGVITLRRLNIDPANDAKNERAGSDMNVELAALDAQGGRTVVPITVARPPLLPQIMQPNPLLIAAGQSGTRLLQLVKDTDLDVTWAVAVDNPDDAGLLIGDPEIIAIDEDGDDGVSLTIEASAPFGREFNLRLTAVGGGYEWDAFLPVVVVAAAAKPHLKLSATVPDSAEPSEPAIVSSFAPTEAEALSIGVALEGEVPSSEELGTPPSFRISVFKLDGSGNPIRVEGDSFVSPGVSDGSKLEIASVPVGERITALGLDVGDVVEVSIEHLLDGEVSDEIIVGDSLRLRVSEGPGSVDADNDGLADSREGESDRGVLGPITAAVAKVTDSGVELQRDVVSLSLGETSRFLGLGECGRVTLTLTLSEDGGASLSGCPDDGAAIDLSQLSVDTNTLMALELEENVEYQLIDLSATFDNSEAEPDEALVIISLPVDPQQPHDVYRFDEDEEMWVRVLGAGLPGQPELGGQGALDDLECDYKSCFYALDFDRDGSVQLLLLLVPIDPLLGLEFALEDASLEGRPIEIGAEKSEIITLLGFEGLTVRITGAAIDGGNVDSSVSEDDSTVELFGLKRTRYGPEEVLVEALDPASGSAVATITLYVTVPNQPPKITFEHEDRDELRLQLPSGEFMTTPTLDLTEVEGVLALAANTETVLLVIIEDAADGDEGFELVLTPEDGRGVANLVSRVMRTTDDLGGVVDVTVHRLTLETTDARAPFKLTLTATDPSDRSSTPIELTVCVLNSEGQCPAAPRRSSGGGGGGGGGTGLLWLLFAAPAALCRATRLRQRLAARARRASP